MKKHLHYSLYHEENPDFCFINHYFKNEFNETRKETVYSNVPLKEGEKLLEQLENAAQYLHDAM